MLELWVPQISHLEKITHFISFKWESTLESGKRNHKSSRLPKNTGTLESTLRNLIHFWESEKINCLMKSERKLSCRFGRSWNSDFNTDSDADSDTNVDADSEPMNAVERTKSNPFFGLKIFTLGIGSVQWTDDRESQSLGQRSPYEQIAYKTLPSESG